MWFGGKVSMISPRAESYQPVKRFQAEETIVPVLDVWFATLTKVGCLILAEAFS